MKENKTTFAEVRLQEHTCHGGVVAGLHDGYIIGVVAVHAMLLSLVVQGGDTGGATQLHLAVYEVLRPHHELQHSTRLHHAVQGVAVVHGRHIFVRDLKERGRAVR